jgi:hypothetical protein
MYHHLSIYLFILWHRLADIYIYIYIYIYTHILNNYYVHMKKQTNCFHTSNSDSKR